MNFYNKQTIRAAFIAAIIAIIVLWTFSKHPRYISQKKIQWEFKGVVEYVHYNSKHIPIVVVNGTSYNLLGTIWDDDYLIKKGDTIIKYKKDLRIRIIRPGTRDTIYDRDTAYRKGY